MKTFLKTAERITGTPRARRLLSAVLALLLYALVWILQDRITFFDVDDRNIAWALAGYRSGSPSFAHPFLNPVTAWAVSSLYRLFSGIPWWYAVQTACLLLAVWTAGVSLLDAAAERGISPVLPILFLAVLDAACFYYALTLVTFTLTSALLGTAACMRLLSARNTRERVWSLLLLAASFLIRQSSGLCAFCFYVGSCAACWLRNRAGEEKTLTSDWKTSLCFLTAAVLLAAALTGVNALGRKTQHPEGFLEFEEARAAFMDYPHDSYSENPELYTEIGWDRNLYALVSAWFYMDGRVNAQTLSRAYRGSSARTQSLAEHAENAAEVIRTFYAKYPIGRILTGIVLLFWLQLLFGKGHGILKLAGTAFLAGTCLLLAYLGWTGRVNLRAVMSLLFPCLGCLMILNVGKLQKDRESGLAARILAGALLILSLAGSYRVFRTVVSYKAEEMLRRSDRVADYVLEHPENLYIRDVYTAIDWNALRVYRNRKPVNLMDWGDCDTGTRARLAQWRANGFDGPQQGDVFLKPGVYYLCTEGEPYLELLAEYMDGSWNASGYEIADRIGEDILVVRFTD